MDVMLHLTVKTGSYMLQGLGGDNEKQGSARGHDGGVDVVDSGADVAAVAVLGQSAQHLIARPRVLDRQHVSVQAVDRLRSEEPTTSEEY